MKLPYPFSRHKHAANEDGHNQRSDPDHLPHLEKHPDPREGNGTEVRFVPLPPDPIFLSACNPYSSPPSSRRIPSMAFSNFATATQPELRVLIVGTGFAGLAAAIACARQGYSVRVLERTDGQSQHGDSVIIGANASRLLYRWGVEDIWERASQGRWLVFKDQVGTTLHQEDLGLLPSQYGAPLLQGKRSYMLGSLGVAARLLGAEIEYNSEVVGYIDSDQPAAYLANGEIRHADVIIVADGINSVSRSLLADNCERRRSGFSIHRAVMTTEAVACDPDCTYFLDGNIRMFLGKEEWISVYPMDNGRQIAFTWTHRDPESVSSLNWKASVAVASILPQLSGWDATLQKLISKFPRAQHWAIIEGEVAEHWISKGGKITFAGDAVHPLIPSSIQGATMAIEDAETLALCLELAGGKPDGVKMALKVYEKLRKPRVEQAARLGRKQAVIYQTFTTRNAPTVAASQTRSSSLSSLTPSDEQTPHCAFAADPSCLRPLAFQMYGGAIDPRIAWESVVRQLDPSRPPLRNEVDPLDEPDSVEDAAWNDAKRARRTSLAFTSDSFTTVCN